MSILWLAEPLPQPPNTLQRLNNMNSLRQKLDHHATEVCALALTSDSAPVWVNAFGPIAFCKFPPGLFGTESHNIQQAALGFRTLKNATRLQRR